MQRFFAWHVSKSRVRDVTLVIKRLNLYENVHSDRTLLKNAEIQETILLFVPDETYCSILSNMY